MPTSAKIILDKRSLSKKGHPLKIYVRNKDKHYIKLGWFCHPDDWDNGILSSHPDYRILNTNFLKRQLDLIKEVEYCNKNRLGLVESVQVIEKGLDDKEEKIQRLRSELRQLEGDVGTMLFEYWNRFIVDRKKRGLSIKVHTDTRKQFGDYLFEQDMRINDITFEFIDEFSNYKLQNGCKQGGLNVYLRTLKAVYKSAQKKESLKIKSTNPFTGTIKESGTTSEIVEMTRNEMELWKSFVPHKFTKKTHAYIMTRRSKIWLFQFYIGGHDLVDTSLLTWKNLRRGRLRFKRYKNRHKPNGGPTVDVLLLPEALEIIDAYGTKDKERIFIFIPDIREEETGYTYYRDNTNRALKKMSKQLGVLDVMKTKSPRYIFRTWAGNAGLGTLPIDQIQGRVPSGVSFRYQAKLPNDIVDEELKKVVYGE